MSQSRNKFIDRFRTQIIQPTNKRSQEKTDRQGQSNSSSQVQTFNTQKSKGKVNDPHKNIVNRLEKHIDYLEKRLKDAQQETERLKNVVDESQKKIIEGQIEQQQLINQVQELNECLRRSEANLEVVKSDYENLVLKQKMEKLSGQVNQRKEAYARLDFKYNQHKKGRFSAAFLPSSFGSPIKCSERNPKEYQNIINEYETKCIQQKEAILESNFNRFISAEFNLIKEENERFFAQIVRLKKQNHCLSQQLKQRQNPDQSSKKQIIQQLTTQNAELKIRLDESLKENKLLLNKLASDEQRMIEISMAINQRSVHQINSIFSSSVTSPQQNNKRESQMQTEDLYNPEAQLSSNQIERRIQIMSKWLEEKDQASERPKIEQKTNENPIIDHSNQKEISDNKKIDSQDTNKEKNDEGLQRDICQQLEESFKDLDILK